MRPARRCLLAIAVSLLWIAAARAAKERATDPLVPLEDQDVVQMIVSGIAPAEIIERLRAARVSFDLSEEMIRELLLAGVTPSVLAAMRERQAQMAPPGPPTPSDDPAARGVPLAVTLSGSDGKSPAFLYLPGRAGDALARSLGLSSRETDERAIVDVAVFLACLTPEHVPDQWRSHSPLGRDFVSMPRHEMLAFSSGARRVVSGDVPGAVRSRVPEPRDGDRTWLRLEIPPELTARLAPGEPHRILLGVAVLVGDRYLMIASAVRAEVLPSEPGARMRAHVVQDKAAEAPVAVRFEDAEEEGVSPASRTRAGTPPAPPW